MAVFDDTLQPEPVLPPCGERHPLPVLPPRKPGSFRRTMQVEVGPRPEFLASMPMNGYARDVHTGMDGQPSVLDEATIEAGFDASRRLDRLVTTPDETWAQAIVGARSGGGYRATLADITPHDRRDSLIRQVLDDLPAAWLISGYAVMRSMIREGVRAEPPGDLDLVMTDVCSGWRAGGDAIRFVKATGIAPHQEGPPVGELGDPGSWLSTQPLALDWMCRRRCMDIAVSDDGEVEVWAMFRDSVGEGGGPETGLHEYIVRARVRGEVIVAVEAEPRVLPFMQCSAAADEVGVLVGTSVDSLATDVGQLLTATKRCTHLNDLLRALGGLSSLLRTARSLHGV